MDAKHRAETRVFLLEAARILLERTSVDPGGFLDPMYDHWLPLKSRQILCDEGADLAMYLIFGG
jgi:hypothetical protein